jgi:hypothetical protein
MMVLGGKRRREPVGYQVITNEEGVVTCELAANKAVSESTRKLFKGLQTGTEILRAVPEAMRVVLDFPVNIGWNASVILNHDDARSKAAEALPNVVGVLVDIEGKQIKVFRDTELAEECGSIFLGHRRHQPLQAVVTEIGPAVHGTHELISSIDPEPPPTLRKQECRVVLISIPNSHFRENPVGSSHAAEDLLDDPVLPILGTNLVLISQESSRVSMARVIREFEVEQANGFGFLRGDQGVQHTLDGISDRYQFAYNRKPSIAVSKKN